MWPSADKGKLLVLYLLLNPKEKEKKGGPVGYFEVGWVISLTKTNIIFFGGGLSPE